MRNMTRREHHQRAHELLGPISERVQQDLKLIRDARLTTEDRDVLAVAQVHATLAAARTEAADPAADILKRRLKEALAELERSNRETSEHEVAAFIRERVLDREDGR